MFHTFVSLLARPLGALVSGDSRLLFVWPFLVHLPHHSADDNLGLPHKVERVSEGLAGSAVQKPESQSSHGLQGHPPLLPHFRAAGVLYFAVDSHTGSRVLAGRRHKGKYF